MPSSRRYNGPFSDGEASGAASEKSPPLNSRWAVGSLSYVPEETMSDAAVNVVGSTRPVAWTEFVAEADAAERLGVAPRTMARWRADGRIAFRTLPGGQVWYHPDDLVALFATAERRGA
jgi:hypothetical protein